MTLTIILITPTVLALLFVIRSHWIVYQQAKHLILCAWYTLRTNAGTALLDDALQVWPDSQIFWEVWNWSWRRYVVYPELYEEIRTWMVTELAREDLTWEFVKAELERTGVQSDELSSMTNMQADPKSSTPEKPFDVSRN